MRKHRKTIEYSIIVIIIGDFDDDVVIVIIDEVHECSNAIYVPEQQLNASILSFWCVIHGSFFFTLVYLFADGA